MTDERDLEQRLRDALAHAGSRVEPAQRLDAIRSAAARPGADLGRSWLRPLAAAAAVAAIAVFAVLAWVGLRPGVPPPTPAGPTPTVTTGVGATSSPSGGTSGASASATADRTAAAATVAVAVPVFHVAAEPGGSGFGLVREFLPALLPTGAGTVDKANAALALAVAVPADNVNHFVAAWPAGTRATWVTLPDPEIGVALTGPGLAGLPEEAQRLAVQALVWTVTGVAGRDAPVSVTVSSGGNIFETVPSNIFKRPGAERAFEEIAPIWLDAPYAGQTLSRQWPVVVSGQACVFEAALAWELSAAGSVVDKGTTHASSGCPQQGSWSVDLGTLKPGGYEFRALAYSAKDGSIAAENVVRFSVG
jgi:immunoglobulin-like protein involved in spore germination